MKQRSDYAPHDRHPAFDEGLAAYNELLAIGFTRSIANPHQPNSLAAQAWDRGYEYGSHLQGWRRLPLSGCASARHNEPVWDHDYRTFECPRCQHEVTEVVKFR